MPKREPARFRRPPSTAHFSWCKWLRRISTGDLVRCETANASIVTRPRTPLPLSIRNPNPGPAPPRPAPGSPTLTPAFYLGLAHTAIIVVGGRGTPTASLAILPLPPPPAIFGRACASRAPVSLTGNPTPDGGPKLCSLPSSPPQPDPVRLPTGNPNPVTTFAKKTPLFPGHPLPPPSPLLLASTYPGLPCFRAHKPSSAGLFPSP